MYFKGVNRGIAFTKPGLYTLGLVLVLGFFAGGSGFNGFFLAAGFGMSLLVISGILSERVMKHYQCTYLSQTVADANTPFTVDFEVGNRHPSWSLLGVENLAVSKLPKFRIYPTKFTAVVEARVYQLRPGETRLVPGSCAGLPRGLHREFYIVQRTLFPFGMITKFKVEQLPCRICVLPPWDRDLSERLDVELRRLLQGSRRPEDFVSHRPLQPKDPHRLVDWKKSAGLDISQWAVKVYESPMEQFNVLVDPNWGSVQAAPTSEKFEKGLSFVRTACEAAHQSGKEVFLSTTTGLAVKGYENCLEWLSSFPVFYPGQTLQLDGGERLPGGAYLRLIVDKDEVRWADALDVFGAAA